MTEWQHEDWISAYLDDELSSEERRQAEARIARDPSLQAQVAQLQQLGDRLRHLPTHRLPATFAAKIREQVSESATAPGATAGESSKGLAYPEPPRVPVAKPSKEELQSWQSGSRRTGWIVAVGVLGTLAATLVLSLMLPPTYWVADASPEAAMSAPAGADEAADRSFEPMMGVAVDSSLAPESLSEDQAEVETVLAETATRNQTEAAGGSVFRTMQGPAQNGQTPGEPGAALSQSGASSNPPSSAMIRSPGGAVDSLENRQSRGGRAEADLARASGMASRSAEAAGQTIEQKADENGRPMAEETRGPVELSLADNEPTADAAPEKTAKFLESEFKRLQTVSAEADGESEWVASIRLSRETDVDQLNEALVKNDFEFSGLQELDRQAQADKLALAAGIGGGGGFGGFEDQPATPAETPGRGGAAMTQPRPSSGGRSRITVESTESNTLTEAESVRGRWHFFSETVSRQLRVQAEPVLLEIEGTPEQVVGFIEDLSLTSEVDVYRYSISHLYSLDAAQLRDDSNQKGAVAVQQELAELGQQQSPDDTVDRLGGEQQDEKDVQQDADQDDKESAPREANSAAGSRPMQFDSGDESGQGVAAAGNAPFGANASAPEMTSGNVRLLSDDSLSRLIEDRRRFAKAADEIQTLGLKQVETEAAIQERNEELTRNDNGVVGNSNNAVERQPEDQRETSDSAVGNQRSDDLLSAARAADGLIRDKANTPTRVRILLYVFPPLPAVSGEVMESAPEPAPDKK